MQAVILAGGLGTRLRPLVPDVPKPMADICGRPFLEYLLVQLRRQGLDHVVLCTGHGGATIESHFGDGRRLGMSLRYSHETEPRGTAGALRLAQHLIEGSPFLVLNGDSFFDIELSDLVRAHTAAHATATLALVEVPDAGRYGRVQLGSATEIVSFVEKGASSGPGLVNAGIYAIERELLDQIPAERQVSLEREVLHAMVGQGLHGLALEGAFVDIGVPAEYSALRDAPEPLLRLLGDQAV